MSTRATMPAAGRFLARTCAVLTVLLLGACASSSAGPEGNWLAPIVDRLTPPTPGETARNAFNLYDADVRRQSVGRLAAAPFGGEEPYLRTYRLLIDDPDPTVRAACAQALGLHGEVADVDLLLPRLRDDETFVRWEAAKSLQRLHAPHAAQPLMRTLQQDDDADVRMAAAAALGQYPSRAVLDVLIGALNDRSFGVMQAANHSLTLLTGQKLGYRTAAWLSWANGNSGRLFEQQQPYTWQPYAKPPGLLDRVQFWDKYEPPAPRTPTGMVTNL